MKLYEIDAAILDCFDEETGEVLDFDKLNALHMEREAKIESAALAAKNYRANAAAIRAEIEALEKRAASCERKAEGYEYWLTQTLENKAFSTAKCEVKFTRSERTEPSENFVEWARQNKRDDLLTIKESITCSPNKAKIKAALNNGEDVPAQITENYKIKIN